jgi:hypothetical protein
VLRPHPLDQPHTALHPTPRSSAARLVRPLPLPLPLPRYAREFLSLRSLVDSIWPSKPPLLLAPDASFDTAWVEAFLAALLNLGKASRAGSGAAGDAVGRSTGRVRSPIDLLSYHVYPLGAGDGTQMLARSLDVSTANSRASIWPVGYLRHKLGHLIPPSRFWSPRLASHFGPPASLYCRRRHFGCDHTANSQNRIYFPLHVLPYSPSFTNWMLPC